MACKEEFTCMFLEGIYLKDKDTKMKERQKGIPHEYNLK